MKYFKLLFAAIAFLVSINIIILGGLYLYRDIEKRTLSAADRKKTSGSFIQLQQGVTHYQLAGPDTGQVVVLLHGFSIPYYIWDDTFNYLANHGYRVLRYDMYGRGYSDRPAIVYNRALFDVQLMQLIQRLHIKTPVNIAGFAFGGMVATNFAITHPQAINKMVLIAPGYEGLMPDKPAAVVKYYESVHPRERAESQLTDFKYPQHYPGWVDRYRVQMQYKGFTNALVSTMFNYAYDGRQSNALLNKRHKPVLLIWGREDNTFAFNYSDSIRSVLNAQFFPVDDAGHTPQMEQHEKVNEKILSFLKQ